MPNHVYKSIEITGSSSKTVEDAINRSNANVGGDILTMGNQAHNVRALGLLGESVDPLDPANVSRAFASIAGACHTRATRRPDSCSST